MEIVKLHEWTPNLWIGAAVLEGLTYVTDVQEFRCRRCGETISLPECSKKTCRTLMALGCSGEMPPKPEWKHPIREKPDPNTRDYPAKRGGQNGKRN